jgi:levanase
LTSPEFTLDRPYLNFLVGGGRHPHETDTVDGPPPPGTVFADFEDDGYGPDWTATGAFAGAQPAAGTLPGQQLVSGYEGARLVNTFVDGDAATGRITSPAFTIEADHVNFLIGGGHHPYPGDASNPPTAVNLVVDGDVVRTATGADSEALNWTSWDVTDLRGRVARIEIVDEHTGGWGHINADHFMFAAAPAAPRSTETAVNLLVDGATARTATGGDSETLDWTSWHVGDLAGRRARIQIVDRNTGGWGHVLADRFTLADAPARSRLERSSWVDFGKDHYAAVTFDDAPDGRRIAIGWMNNWSYSGAIPTSPWRSAMSVPRELELQTIGGAPRLISAPVDELHALRGPESAAQQVRRRALRAGATETLPVRGTALELEAVLRVGTRGRTGLKVRTGAGGEETIIGYDAGSREVYVDRRASGADGFSRDFARDVQRAPLPPRDGKVRLRVLVDWSSVEVFGDRGQVVISDQIYPSADSDGVALFAEGAGAVVESLRAWPLRSIWTESRRRHRR